MLGEPFMQHQQHMSDVILEVDPATGLLVYRSYVIVLPRQNGKTSWVRSKLAHRHLGFSEPDPDNPGRRRNIAQHTVYAAQTGDKSRDKWLHDQVERYQRSPLAENIADVWTRLNGERLLWRNGSTHCPVTPSAKTGGTGESLDETVIDEAWAREDSSLESAMLPTMDTRREPQMGILSTAKRQPEGQHSRTFAAYLRGKIREGRGRIEAGIESDTAFFDWSSPTDKDPGDPATWWAHIPALSGGLVTEKTIASNFLTMERPNFCAEYLGWFEDESAALWRVISEPAWAALGDRDLKPGYPLAFAVDVTPGRGMAAVCSAGPALAWQRMCVEVVEHRQGTEWVVPRLVGLIERWSPCGVAINPGSAASSLLKPLKNALVAANIDPEVIKTPTVREVAAAYGMFLDRVTDARNLRHAAQPALDLAVSLAQKRNVAGGGACWDWNSPGDVTTVQGCTLAAWCATVFGPAHQASDYDVLRSVF
jgi:hypothetical protein